MRFRMKGFSLLEVMIAVLVFSLGLLGVGGLMVLSVRTNHSAFLRTQASFLAQSMADRIRTNVGWTLSYNGTYDATTAGSGDCTGGICSPESLVQRDKEIWSRQLTDMLPNASAQIACNGTQLGSGAQRGSAPFDGLCQMVIVWTEADLSRGTGGTPQAPATNTFAWVFQP
jgi:type IV pilus assembly protein PilV